ncbi:MAG: MFS transporter, partial [Thermoanaerobaculia bacterium]|nr:MFS transporter [Thermoanaerobaculia bacterium]
MVSLTGTWMQSVAQSWLAYRLTGSAALLGIVAFASQVPAFLVAPLGGVVADRAERRRVLIATQVASMLLALLLAALTLSDRIRVPHLIVLAALLGLVNGIDMPARQSFIVEMVGRDDLPNAIALNS